MTPATRPRAEQHTRVIHPAASADVPDSPCPACGTVTPCTAWQVQDYGLAAHPEHVCPRCRLTWWGPSVLWMHDAD